MPRPAAIFVQDLVKKFHIRNWLKTRDILALNQISLEVQAGEVLGIIGPNGSGKSTLLRILATILLPSSGFVSVAGHPMNQTEKIKNSVGIVTSEAHGFWGRLNAVQNLKFFAALQRIPEKLTDERVDQLLDTTGLSEMGDQPVWTYSTGQRQRLNIARTLLHDPEILLFDEPTKGLDPWMAGLIRDWIRTELIQKRGKTLLIATNQMEDVHELCDQVAHLKRGQIISYGSPESLKIDSKDQVYSCK